MFGGFSVYIYISCSVCFNMGSRDISLEDKCIKRLTSFPESARHSGGMFGGFSVYIYISCSVCFNMGSRDISRNVHKAFLFSYY